MTDAMEEYQIEYMEDLEEIFQGRQFISNWVMDFELELSNASREDKKYSEKKIEFCSDYLARLKNKEDLNNLVLRRSIAEAHFHLGNTEEGERLFKQYVEEHPTDGWGWINWSDQYWIDAEEENKNLERAIQILEQGLAVDQVEYRIDVLERLEVLFTESGMTAEASEVKREIKEEKEKEERKWNQKWEETFQSGKKIIQKIKTEILKPKKSAGTNRAPVEAGRSIRSVAENNG